MLGTNRVECVAPDFSIKGRYIRGQTSRTVGLRSDVLFLWPLAWPVTWDDPVWVASGAANEYQAFVLSNTERDDSFAWESAPDGNGGEKSFVVSEVKISADAMNLRQVALERPLIESISIDNS